MDKGKCDRYNPGAKFEGNRCSMGDCAEHIGINRCCFECPDAKDCPVVCME